MTINLYSPVRLMLVMLAMLLSWNPVTTQAAWWSFGAADDIPEISDLKFNNVALDHVDGQMILGRDALENGRITVRGLAEVGDGKIGKVELSFDGGQNWQPTKLGSNGLFIYENFQPTLDREYEFHIRALTTTGKNSPPEENHFFFTVTSRDETQIVRQAFLNLIKLYAAENRAGFIALVSPEFEGNLSELEDAIEDDFRYFDNIRIEPNIVRIIQFDGKYEVYFTFNRQLQSTRSGRLLKDSAASTATFSRVGEQFMLHEMAAPLIFGLSNPTELATSVTEESVGQEVIVVSESGDVGTTTQAATVEDAISGEIETGSLSQNFNFPADYMDVVNVEDNSLSQVDFATVTGGGLSAGEWGVYRDCSAGPNFYTLGGGQIRSMGPGNVDSNVTFPTSGFAAAGFGLPGDLSVTDGYLYAFKADGGGNYLIEIVNVTPDTSNGNCIYSSTTSYRYKEVP